MTAWRPVLAAALAVAALTLTGCTGDLPPGGTPARLIPLPPAVPDLQQAYVGVVSDVLPSVVQINTDGSVGSGVVFDAKGNIVTNAHLVGQATKFQVRLADSPKPLPARLVGSPGYLANLDPGRTVPVTVTTAQGATRTVQVTLGQLPGS